MIPVILGAAAQILEMILKTTRKDPSTVPHFAPVIGQLISVASQATGETAQETADRMAIHNSLVAAYAAGPPPGANV